MFIEEQAREYNGTDHVYNADSFNEMTPPSSDPSYLASSSKSILGAMQIADPEAIWLMQGWLFQDTSFWKPTQMRALLTGNCTGNFLCQKTVLTTRVGAEIQSTQLTNIHCSLNHSFSWICFG